MVDAILYRLAEELGQALTVRELMLVTAESCTGGWIAETITRVPGSSNWFERGFVTYTYISKREMLGVSSETLDQYGAVSEQTVCEMVLGALKNSHAQVAIAVSGVAGPDGGSEKKPVGTVCFAWAIKAGELIAETKLFVGDRHAIRKKAVKHALKNALAMVPRT